MGREFPASPGQRVEQAAAAASRFFARHIFSISKPWAYSPAESSVQSRKKTVPLVIYTTKGTAVYSGFLHGNAVPDS